MERLKVCFVGIGSIAKRHIKNLQTVCNKREIEIQIDAFRHSSGTNDIKGVNRVYTNVNDIPDDYDVIFITNPTKFHLSTLRDFHDKGKNFFIEKPLSSIEQLDDARSFTLRDDAVYYVAGPLRYNAVIKYIKENVDPSDVISIRCISSSYLPDWRPGQDYRETYSAKKALGGGVSIDLIHEWDYITAIFGQPKKVLYMAGKKSQLEIDTEDYAIYMAEYIDKIAEIHLDYFGRKTIREIQLFMKGDTVVGDLVNNRISFMKSGKVIDFHEDRDDYQKRELEHFLDMISGIIPKEDGFHHAIKVLDLTQGKIR